MEAVNHAQNIEATAHSGNAIPGMFPEYIDIFGLHLSQTLLTSLISLWIFLIFVLIYNKLKAKNESNFFVAMIDMLIETMDDFFGSVSDKIPSSVKTYILFLFVYILWNNLFGLILDMFATVAPVLHHNFRPVSTDIYFNAMLAVFGVIWSIAYWFQNNGLHFIERYIPLKGFGIAWGKPEQIWKLPLWLIVKILDILLGLFIWFLEFIWEFTKVLSLTLRLFWNIFAWVVLLILIVGAAITAMKVPFLAPLVVVAMELLVSFLQAFVFALLVLIYFKMAEESH